MMNRIAAALLFAGFFAAPVAAASTPAPATALTSAEQAVVFKTAGFTERGGKWIRCEEEMASATPGRIELVDLNGDGRPEAWVTEGNLGCYGNTAEWFALVTKDANGTWRTLLDGVGVPTALKTTHNGWPDIEVGGPGFGKFPVYRWNGKAYVTR